MPTQHLPAPPTRGRPPRRRRVADQRGHCPVSRVLAHRQEVGRPLRRRRDPARPVLTTEVLAEQNRQNSLEAGTTIERVLSDNGGAYRSHLWRDTCEALSITPKQTRLYRPQTNGKVVRFHRTMADGWVYARCYASERERRDALETWLHHYNHHRPHTACGSRPPFTRLIDVPGQYS